MRHDLSSWAELVGTDLDRWWRDPSATEQAFTGRAVACLENNWLDEVGAEDVYGAIAASVGVADQYDLTARFGTVPYTLFSGERVLVHLLLWNEGSTAVHSHNFAGAFGVLAGESLHSSFSFAEQGDHDRCGLVLGRLDRVHLEHLGCGAIRPIGSGTTTIHGLFHLRNPSISVVVRTKGAGAEFKFLDGGLAYDPFRAGQHLLRQIQLIRLLSKGPRLRLTYYARRMLARAEPYDAAVLLDTLGQLLLPESTFDALVGEVAGRDGCDWAATIFSGDGARLLRQLDGARRVSPDERERRLLGAAFLLAFGAEPPVPSWATDGSRVEDWLADLTGGCHELRDIHQVVSRG